MSNDLEVLRDSSGSGLPVTDADVSALKGQREMLRQFVSSQLRENVDFGVIPGTQKATLYKPGAEKLSRLFGLGVTLTLVDKEIDHDHNFAMFTYKARVCRLKDPSVIISDCDGSCNSKESKYKERKKYEYVTNQRADGTDYQKKVAVGTDITPIYDVMNTLQKMAQKRAMVGAIILAVAGSDFFSQDIDDPEDAKVLGITPKSEPQKASVSVPNVSSAKSEVNSDAPKCCGRSMMVSKYLDEELGHKPWYCVSCKKKIPV